MICALAFYGSVLFTNVLFYVILLLVLFVFRLSKCNTKLFLISAIFPGCRLTRRVCVKLSRWETLAGCWNSSTVAISIKHPISWLLTEENVEVDVPNQTKKMSEAKQKQTKFKPSKARDVIFHLLFWNNFPLQWPSELGSIFVMTNKQLLFLLYYVTFHGFVLMT